VEIFSSCFLQPGRDKATKADPDQQTAGLDQEFPEEVHRAFGGLPTLLSTVRQARALIPWLREGLLQKSFQLQN
jgi:hypothetical protein